MTTFHSRYIMVCTRLTVYHLAAYGITTLCCRYTCQSALLGCSLFLQLLAVFGWVINYFSWAIQRHHEFHNSYVALCCWPQPVQYKLIMHWLQCIITYNALAVVCATLHKYQWLDHYDTFKTRLGFLYSISNQ